MLLNQVNTSYHFSNRVLYLIFALSRRRAARAEETAAIARSKSATARNKARVPDVSSNLKGVTASQTIEPVKPADKAQDDTYVDDR